jgi:hypothetical protein
VMLFWYFRYNNKFGWKSFIKFGLVSLLIFLIVYPGIVTILPSLLDGEFRIGRTAVSNTAISLIPVVLIIGAIYGIYRSIIKRNRTLNIALLSFLLIILGYSTYTLVFIRANAHPPMNENDPSTMERLVSYLNREQYGSTPILNRRWEIDPVKKQYQRMYSSDLDYMLRYQIVHMYFRYFGWNYIGSAGDFRNAGVDWKQFYMVPFLFGLLGLYYQWRKQPNMALPMTVTFIIMGVILALYQNQQEPQPRERDYFYVGSFFVFSLWIAYGVLTLMEFARTRIKHGRSARQTAYGILIFAFVFVPFNMFRTNYRQANRSGNYMPWDYSYNLLQSCEPDAILITNGDNDTFPLWYLQDVEGIRRDIRIVNLSLANARWYIRQLKNETPYGAKKVPISMADVEIENIKPVQFESRWMTLPVSPSVVQKLRAEGGNAVSLIDTSVTNSGVLRFFMPSTMQYGKYKFIRSQDILLYDIVHTSKWQRPIYFAMTVSNENKIGLHNCSQMTGLAFKLVPQMTQNYWMNLDENSVKKNIFTDIGQPSKEPAYGFLWRGFQDSTTYYDEDTRQLIMANYRNLFISYALYCMNVKKETQLVPAILDRMEKVIPRRSVRMDYRIKYDLASFYAKAGDSMHSDEFIDEVIGEAREIINKPVDENLSQYNPFMILYYCYLEKGNYSDAQELLPKLKSAYQSQQGIDNLIKRLQDQIDVKKGGKAAR